MKEKFEYKYNTNIEKTQLVELFKSVNWKTGNHPEDLHLAIKNSDYVMSVWKDNELIGLISAISDKAINVFVTYLLVKPKYQKQGLGKVMMNDFCKKYKGFGRRIITTELDKEEYYNKFNFSVKGISMFNYDWKNDC